MEMEGIREKILAMFFVVWVIVLTGAGQTISIKAADGPYASNPDPADGGMTLGYIYPSTEIIFAELSFVPGSTAVKHTGYFSEDYSKVAGRDQDANLGPPPYAGYPGKEYTYYVGRPDIPPATESLVRGKTYYWAVDETDALGNIFPGDVWEFTVWDFYASSPSPPNEAKFVSTDVLLSWKPGFDGSISNFEHDIYFGTSRDWLEPIGTTTETYYQCSGLAFGTKYYWRVDEVWDRLPPVIPGTVYEGPVWCFTTRLPQIFVDIDATGANDGSSWADALNYLQDALSVALPGDEIYVAQGTYKPDQGAGITPGDRTATFQLISGVTVKGGYAGFGEPDPNSRDIELYETILSGDLSSNDVEVADPCDLLTEPTRAENSYHVVTGSENGVVDGFIITAGNAVNRPGGGMENYLGSQTLINCIFRGNSSGRNGGGLYNELGSPTLINCLFTGNSARNGGGIWCGDSGNTTLVNCTFSNNLAELRVGGIGNNESHVVVTNCILWGNRDSTGVVLWAQISYGEDTVVNYSCIQGLTGEFGGNGNIGDDPLFVDADGIDNIAGTEDDNLRLLAGSPCIDTGDNSVVTVTTDLDGNPRIANGVVDMGAYEFQGPFKQYYHVDGVNGDNTNDGLTRETAFKTIQRGINVAEDFDTVLVWPGIYSEEIAFWGDAITVKSAADAAIVETDYGYAFSFFSAEGPDTVLRNFVIRNSQYGIYLINGASPTLRSLTIVNNDFGISAFNGADPDISSCIFWNNYYGDLFREPVPLQAKYSCIEEGGEGEGNISIEPGFVDANSGDYHLLSERGRYWLAHNVWVLDDVTSPCVDGGDPTIDPSNERMPNGGRINMGAYGNTAYASMSEWPLKHDSNFDGVVNMLDIAELALEWLETIPVIPEPNVPDTLAPLPDPMQWDTELDANGYDGRPLEVYLELTGDYGATMRAINADDQAPTGGTPTEVEYYFYCVKYPEEVGKGGFSSGWRTVGDYPDETVRRNYTVRIGTSGQALQFQVKARDTSANKNETEYSTPYPAVYRNPP